MRYLLLFLTFLTLSLCFINTTFAQAKNDFVKNEILVKYKTAQSPVELKKIIEERSNKRKTVVGFFSLFWADFKNKLKKQDTPETKLFRIQNAAKKAEVLEEKELSSSGLYRFILKKNNAEDAARIFTSLPEVEYAELNYIIRIPPNEIP